MTDPHDLRIKPGQIRNIFSTSNDSVFQLNKGNGEQVAYISPEGIMSFTIAANDENAAKFVNCIENIIKRRLTGLDVNIKNSENTHA